MITIDLTKTKDAVIGAECVQIDNSLRVSSRLDECVVILTPVQALQLKARLTAAIDQATGIIMAQRRRRSRLPVNAAHA